MSTVALFDSLLRKLSSSEVFEIVTPARQDVQVMLKEWAAKLQDLQRVLNDAEGKELTDKSPKQWLRDLQDLAYDMDDILDVFANEILELTVMQKQRITSTSKAEKLTSASFFTRSISLDALWLNIEKKMIEKMKNVSARLDYLASKKDELALNEIHTSMSITIRKKESISLEDHNIYTDWGQIHKNKIVDLLFTNPGNRPDVDGICIIGTGGIGKTFLAKHVYNHGDQVKHYFDVKIWVRVPREFDVTRITKGILEGITSEAYGVTDLKMLQLKLKEKLNDKKFLIVFDDVWDVSYTDWQIVRSPLKVGAPGSKILVTTRCQTVLNCIGKNFSSYTLWPLRPKASLSILAYYALRRRDFSEYSQLKHIGIQIVKECGGLPLVIRVIGQLLRDHLNQEKWLGILKKLRQVRNSWPWPALQLNYTYLPPLLKQCFAYCSILPESYEFTAEEIVLLWMAQGFLSEEATNRTQMETLGRLYFQELVVRTFFQRSSLDKSRFVMPDIINELAGFFARPICHRLESFWPLYISNQVRHLSCEIPLTNEFKNFKTPQKLRTFMQFRSPNDILLDLLPRMEFLRVLSLRELSMSTLPDFIGNLRHLRYLDLSHAAITSLPDSICALYHLQTLLLSQCLNLAKLPSKMGKLVNLRHLDLTGAFSLTTELENLIGQLANLQTLYTPDGRRVDLRNQFFSGSDYITTEDGLEEITKLGEQFPKKKIIIFAKHRWLKPKWSDNSNDGKRLEELVIEGYDDTIFPKWLLDHSLFSSLVSLELSNCKRCTSMLSVGNLQALRHLCIKGMSSIKNIEVCCFAGNLSLETLSFEDLPQWKGWDFDEQQTGNFRRLREMSLIGCPKLSGKLPTQLPSLEKLMIQRCNQLVVSISSLPMLHQLEIDGCKMLDVHESPVELTSLKRLSLSNISELTCFPESLMLRLIKVESLKIDGCQGLTSLWKNQWEALVRMRSLKVLMVFNCPKLVPFGADEDEEEQQQLVMPCTIDHLNLSLTSNELTKVSGLFTLLREIHVENCPLLVSLSEESFPITLKRLVIRYCDKLKYFLVKVKYMNVRNISLLESLEIEKCSSLIALSSNSELPIGLQKLHIDDCPKLVSLSSSTKLPRGLKQLHISHCPNLESIGDELPVELQSLQIWYCENLRALSQSGTLPKELRHLQISNCTRLQSIAGEIYENRALKYIGVIGCVNIKSLPKGLDLSLLEEIVFVYCPSLSFEESWLPITDLKVLHIDDCKELKAFPGNFQKSSALEELVMSHCPFPDKGFPVKLKSLSISQPKPSKPFRKWGLDNLTCLQLLTIEGGCPNMVSFPPEYSVFMLPNSLVQLSIKGFPSLIFLFSTGFEMLKKLKYLSIMDCPKLRFLPTKNALASIVRLHIDDCPLLRPKCKINGKEWPKIAHIPYVRIDDALISAKN